VVPPSTSGAVARVTPGERVAVRYIQGDQRFIHPGRTCLVNAYGVSPRRDGRRPVREES
jgi:hypothetical protein